MSENETSLRDLIYYSANQKPIEFEDAFKELMSDRVSSAIENKKLELAQNIFSDEQINDDEDDDEVEVEQDYEETEIEQEEEDAETT